MKKLYTSICVGILFFACVPYPKLQAQCLAGYTQATINWDNLDYLPSNNSNYSGYYPSSSFPYTQNFELGTQTTTITVGPDYTLYGESPVNTGDLTVGGIAYTGDDVRFVPNTAAVGEDIVIEFENEVMNVSFTLYSIDASASFAVSAEDALAAPLLVNTTLQSPTILTVSGVLSKTITAGAGTVADNANDGSVTIGVTGPVKKITITCLNRGTANRYVYLSDIVACVTGNMPVNYHSFSQPFTGQPAYVLVVVDNKFYYVNTANGDARYLFTDASHTNMNSVAYDPANRIIYYTYSLTGSAQNDKAVRKYDMNTGTISTIIPDVSALGVSTYQSGVESGAAAFYDGCLYLGIEGYNNSGSGAGRKSCVWRIEFDGSLNPTMASQVYGSMADNGSSRTNIHDWSDFTIESGVLYDFDGSVSDMDIFHYDMMTGQVVNAYVPVWRPSQVSVDWNGIPYQIDGNIAPYNYDGTVDSLNLFAITEKGVPLSGSWGDAGGAIRPFCDFGDAPASYDPVALSPAVNEQDTALRLGPSTQIEWNKTSSVLADADPDEDAIGTVTILSTVTSIYYVNVDVYNNTGSDAVLRGWLDYNGNGVFDPGESSMQITVASTPSDQSVHLTWWGVSTPLPVGATTYLRIRLTSLSNGMTANDATGYFSSGETEDYLVIVDNVPLDIILEDFDANLVNTNSAELSWTATEDARSVGYTIQKSTNAIDWTDAGFVAAKGPGQSNDYIYLDENLPAGKIYYRLRTDEGGGYTKYSETKSVVVNVTSAALTIFPNPATSTVRLTAQDLETGEQIRIHIMDQNGRMIFRKSIQATGSRQQVDLPIRESWPGGAYVVQLITQKGTVNKKLIIKK